MLIQRLLHFDELLAPQDLHNGTRVFLAYEVGNPQHKTME